MTVELDRFLAAQHDDEVPEWAREEFVRWNHFLEEHGLAEYYEDADGDMDCRITERGDQLFCTLGAAIPFEKLVVMLQIRMGEVALDGGFDDGGGVSDN